MSLDPKQESLTAFGLFSHKPTVNILKMVKNRQGKLWNLFIFAYESRLYGIKTGKCIIVVFLIKPQESINILVDKLIKLPDSSKVLVDPLNHNMCQVLVLISE